MEEPLVRSQCARFTAIFYHPRTCWVYVFGRLALAWWLIWLEHRLGCQNVVGSVPSQGTSLGSRFSPHSGCVRGATAGCFCLTSVFLSLSLLLFLPLISTPSGEE